MRCGTDRDICVDHIRPRKKFKELELEFDNLQVLCRSCNSWKGSSRYEDFRRTSPDPALRPAAYDLASLQLEVARHIDEGWANASSDRAKFLKVIFDMGVSNPQF
jgi:hypothetical protein